MFLEEIFPSGFGIIRLMIRTVSHFPGPLRFSIGSKRTGHDRGRRNHTPQPVRPAPSFILLALLVPFLFPAPRLSADPAVGAAEAVFSNLLLGGFNRYVLRADYAMISASSVSKNLEGPWVWDQDSFAVNHLGHPYHGSVYFSGARSSGSGFYTSAGITLFGSITWELFMETEPPSWNDLLVSTIGGTGLGEMLFRLSDVLLYGEEGSYRIKNTARRVSAFAISPMKALNRSFYPDVRIYSAPVEGYFMFGAGFSWTSAELADVEAAELKTAGPVGSYDFSIRYGNPLYGLFYLPFDYFSLSGNIGHSRGSELYITLFSHGMLDGRKFYGKNHRHVLGLFLHYDVVYNRIINLSSNALGLGWIRESRRERGWNGFTSLHASFVFMGASDILYLKYGDLYDTPPDYERRNYSLSFGGNLKATANLNWNGRFHIDAGYTLYRLSIIEESVPEGGSPGSEIIGSASLLARMVLRKDWFIGLQGRFYHKNSFYDLLDDPEHRNFQTSLVAGITL
jgi:hypothetical protein